MRMQITLQKSTYPIVQVIVFFIIYTLLLWLWGWARNSAFAHFLIEDVTVKTAVGFVNLISPNFNSIAHGTHMTSSAGGINVVNGCEGVEVMFLLIAAMIISPLSVRAKIVGILVGLIYIFFLNQVRLVVMFYAVRENKQLFELVHGTIAPIILVALTGFFLALWISSFGNSINTSNVKVSHAVSD